MLHRFNVDSVKSHLSACPHAISHWRYIHFVHYVNPFSATTRYQDEVLSGKNSDMKCAY